MLRTVDRKMKPLRGFGFLDIHFSIDMLSLREKHRGMVEKYHAIYLPVRAFISIEKMLKNKTISVGDS
jgi:hypothetical protein